MNQFSTNFIENMSSRNRAITQSSTYLSMVVIVFFCARYGINILYTLMVASTAALTIGFSLTAFFGGFRSKRKIEAEAQVVESNEGSQSGGNTKTSEPPGASEASTVGSEHFIP